MARKRGTRKRRRGDPYRVVLRPFSEIRRLTRTGGRYVFRTVTTSKRAAGRLTRKRPSYT